MSIVTDNWSKIWNGKQADEHLLNRDFETVFMELKRLTGNDTTGGNGVTFDGFKDQYFRIKKYLRMNMAESKSASIFEVGCGSGPFLLMFQKDGFRVGGCDYSSSLIDVAKKVLSHPVELYCGEAVDIDPDVKYDSVMSNSVFEYFESDEYAEKVMQKMLEKAEYSIGIFDVHDAEKKDEYLQYRRSIIQNYDEKYKNLDKKFFNKSFFERFAKKNQVMIEFRETNIRGYWNNEFVYDVYMYKR